MKAPLSILVIDDNEERLGLIKCWIEDLGHTDITCCSSYSEASNVIKSKKFSVVVADYTLGPINSSSGKDFVRNYSKSDTAHTFKSIIFTGEIRVVPENDRDGVLDIFDLKNEIVKALTAEAPQKVKSDTEERFILQKVCSLSETVAQHEVRIGATEYDVKEVKADVKDIKNTTIEIRNSLKVIELKFAPLEGFAFKNDKIGEQIKGRVTLFVLVFGLIITILLAFK